MGGKRLAAQSDWAMEKRLAAQSDWAMEKRLAAQSDWAMEKHRVTGLALGYGEKASSTE